MTKIMHNGGHWDQRRIGGTPASRRGAIPARRGLAGLDDEIQVVGAFDHAFVIAGESSVLTRDHLQLEAS